MAELLLEIKSAVEATLEPAMSLSPADLTTFEKRYDEVVESGFEANPAPAATAEGEVKKPGRDEMWSYVQTPPRAGEA